MFNYPVMLNLTNVSCLVVGAGPVGIRKALCLLEAEAKKVILVAPSVPAETEAKLEKFSAFTREVRSFRESDLSNVTLVFAATDDLELNRNIAEACAARGLLCNNASSYGNEVNGSSGDFCVPASFKAQGLSVAVGADSVETVNPALTKLICADLREVVSQRYGKAVEFMAFARPRIIGLNFSKDIRREFLIRLAELSLAFNEAGFRSLKQIMEAYLPVELTREIENKLFELKERQG